MAQKTVSGTGSVDDWLAAIADAGRRSDASALLKSLGAASGMPPVMWGSMVGFGAYHYRYESGTEGDTFAIGFAARSSEFAIYLHGAGYDDVAAQRDALLARLGKHRMGKGCLYIKRISDIDLTVLGALAKLAFARISSEYQVKNPT